MIKEIKQYGYMIETSLLYILKKTNWILEKVVTVKNKGVSLYCDYTVTPVYYCSSFPDFSGYTKGLLA